MQYSIESPMPLSSVNEAAIRSHANERSFQRGESYYRQGAVVSLIQRENTLMGQVEGSEYEPYRVSVQFDEGGIAIATCTCAYNFSGWCKHIVATLLKSVHSSKDIQQRPSLSELLAPLTRDQLQTLLEDLSIEQPELIEQIELRLQQENISAQPTALQSATRQTVIDPQPFYRQIQQILHQNTGTWDDSPALDEVRTVIDKADAFTCRGDGENAIAILAAVIDAYRESWMNLDGSSGESGNLFYELDEAFAEALLSAAIATDDQLKWQETIEIWEDDAADYGINAAFAKSQAALVQGWDDPELLAILQGETTDGSELEEPDAQGGCTLTQIRLVILQRQERYEEYLNLAKAKACEQEYLTMLVQQDQLELAVTEAHHQLNHPTAALAVAKALRGKGVLDQALQVAELGLKLPEHGKAELAKWISELAEGLGHTSTSLQVRITAFTETPSLRDYLKIQELADSAEWPKLKETLLTNLREEHRFAVRAAVDIFLHEGLLEDAIEIVDRWSSYDSSPIQQVMEAAMAKRPDWVIKNARRRAEAIMDEGKANYYGDAVDWLKLAHRAYQQSEQLQKWQSYYAKLLQKRARKRKLIGLLEIFG